MADSGAASKWVAHKAPSSGGQAAAKPFKKRISVTGIARVVKQADTSAEPSASSPVSVAPAAATVTAAAPSTKAGDSPVLRTIRPKVIRTIRSSDTDSLSATAGDAAATESRGRRATINIGAVQPDWLKKQAPTVNEATTGGSLAPSSALGSGAAARRKANRRSLVINPKDLVVPRSAATATAALSENEGRLAAVPKVVVSRARQQRVETVCVSQEDVLDGRGPVAGNGSNAAVGVVTQELERQASGSLSPPKGEAVKASQGEEAFARQGDQLRSEANDAYGEAKSELEDHSAVPDRKLLGPDVRDASSGRGSPTAWVDAPAELGDSAQEDAGQAMNAKEETAKEETDALSHEPEKEMMEEQREEQVAEEKSPGEETREKDLERNVEDASDAAKSQEPGEENVEKGKLSRITSNKKLSWIVHGLQKAKRNSTSSILIGHDQAEQKEFAAKQEAGSLPPIKQSAVQETKTGASSSASIDSTPAKLAPATSLPQGESSSCKAKQVEASASNSASEAPPGPGAKSMDVPTVGTEEEKESSEEDELAKVREEHTGKTREDKRKEILQEVVDTEEGYFSDLGVLMQVFLEPIRKQELLTKQQISSVFANLEAIYPVNEGMLAALRELQAGKTQSSIGELFIERSVLFKLYAVYCSNQPNIRDRILALKKELPEFDEFLKKQFRRAECRKLDLEAFLIKPLQRLCKYPLLLKELLKNTGSDHPEFAALHQARTQISAIVTKVNERVRQVENLNKLIAISKEVDAESIEIVVQNRNFVHEGPLTINKRPCYCYLFSDTFLICRIKKKKEEDVREASRLAPLTMVSVAELEDVDEAKNRFEIAEVGHKIMVARAGSRIKKKQWLKHLTSCISAVEVNEADKERALSTLRRLSNAPAIPRAVSTPRGGNQKSGEGGKAGGSRIAVKDSVKKLTENWEQRAKLPEPKGGALAAVMIDPRIKKMSTAEKERRIMELERTLEAFKVRCIEMKGVLKHEKSARIDAEKRAAHLQDVISSASEPHQGVERMRRDTVLDEQMPGSRGRSAVVVESSSDERLNTLNNMVDKITEENFRLRQKLKAAKVYVAGLEERLRGVPEEAYHPEEDADPASDVGSGEEGEESSA